MRPTIALYLKRSPKTRVYSFRIAVPLAVRAIIGKREIKQSLKTKDEREALAKAIPLHTSAMKLFEAARAGRRSEVQSPRQTYEAALQWAEAMGFDPMKTPDPYSDEDEFLARDDLADQLKTKVESGKATPLETMKLNALVGSPTPPLPTITEMVSLYLAEKNRPQDRIEADRKSFEQMVRRYEGYLLRSLRSDKTVTKVNRSDARAFRDWLATNRTDAKALRPGSINKALQIVRAMFNLAITEWELNTANPFAKLEVEDPEGARGKRRPFTDDELIRYLKAAERMNDQAKNCTILMAYTGARTEELTGLECGDISLDGDYPHINIRPNATRPKLKTDASKRLVPLIGPAVQAAADALSSLTVCKPTTPAFPRYSHERGEDALSALQNKLIRTRLKITDPKLVAYGTRHTIKDRLRNALVPPDLQDAILGHSRGQVSEGYGAGYWLPRLVEALTKAHSL